VFQRIHFDVKSYYPSDGDFTVVGFWMSTYLHEGPYKYFLLFHVSNFHIFTTACFHYIIFTVLNLNVEEVLTIEGR
jgi:hypothetical protein